MTILMKYTISAILILMISTSFRPGVSTVVLKATSASGRTFFNAEFEDGEILQNAELSIDSQIIHFTHHDIGNVIEDLSNKVYTIHLQNNDEGSDMSNSNFVNFWALPPTIQEIKDDSHQYNYIYKFRAKLRAKDPRTNKEYSTPEITLNCILSSVGP